MVTAGSQDSSDGQMLDWLSLEQFLIQEQAVGEQVCELRDSLLTR